MAVIVSSKWCGIVALRSLSTTAEFLISLGPTTAAKKAKTSRVNKIADFIAQFIKNGLQILGCELHQNAFGGRAPPGPAVEAIVVPQTA